ncbi:GH36-type glycosyl hydrolase domain-containing protein [Labrys sedimenti]|uniref:GH36-type glycosyl hydrolase domain-containing protein n=1 Tax=Labrys sedimenti TaxID=3106036 RepID=UPI003019BA73
MATLNKHLIRREDGLALPFTPPFDTTSRDPGYMKGYPPGLHENGGQCSHAAMGRSWPLQSRRTVRQLPTCFRFLIRSTMRRRPTRSSGYELAPYPTAADVYSVPPHMGRGG